MTRSGRPLRFLIAVLGVWAGIRTWQLWPEPPLPPALRAVARRIVARVETPEAQPIAHPPQLAAIPPRDRAPLSVTTWLARSKAPPTQHPPIVAPSSSDPVPPATAQAPIERTPAYVIGLLGMIRYGTPNPPPRHPRRWSASGWTIVRGAGPGGGVATPQLGGGQMGARVARTLDTRGTVALVARMAAGLGTRAQEAGVGIEWRPTALPIRIVAERRIGLAGVRGGTTLGLVGGIDDVALPAGFRLDGYAQAGAIARDRLDAYADGAVQLVRAVAGSERGATLSLGLGAWGASQRGAARLDLGPTATMEAPIGDGGPRVRVALAWRERVMGQARPGSGPALSIGADY